MPRTDEEYHTVDFNFRNVYQEVIHRVYKNLIKDKQLFGDIHAYVMGDFDKSLFVISRKNK